MTQKVKKLVTADGTYATQSAFSSLPATKEKDDLPTMRGYLMDGDFFVASALATSLTKLALKYIVLVDNPRRQNVIYFLVICLLFNISFDGGMQKLAYGHISSCLLVVR